MCQKADLQMEAEESEQNRADIRQLMAHGSNLEARQKMVQMAALFHVIKQNQSIARYYVIPILCSLYPLRNAGQHSCIFKTFSLIVDDSPNYMP